MRLKMPQDAPGLIALVLAVGLALGFAGALLISAGARTPPLGDNISTLLSTIGGGMIGCVATYLGVVATKRREQPPEPPRLYDQAVDEAPTKVNWPKPT